MSQIMRATFVSPSFHGISWKVSGSGIATMSDSSIALKPVIDEPSKPMPSSSASSISLGVTAKLFRWPSMSENQSRPNSTPSCSIRACTRLRVSSLDVVLLQVARELSARFVQVSTDEVYGDIELGWSSREDDPLRPSSPYSASKAGGDLQVLAGVRTYGVNASVTRGSNTYGPNQYPEKL